jgi:SAM-dependent methyltransferase
MDKESTRKIFQDIYERHTWPSQESLSGSGSDHRNTERIIRELPELLGRIGVRSILDIPCGDFHWMQRVNLSGIQYIGADIVDDLVESNQKRYGSPNRQFLHLDLLTEDLPACDLVFCRDCLFHFSHADVFRALRNLVRSKAKYLLTTTFTYRTYPRNGNIRTGEWTPINLEMPPYQLPPPQTVLIEGSHECIVYGDGIEVPMFDRCLGLWKLSDIRQRLSDLP